MEINEAAVLAEVQAAFDAYEGGLRRADAALLDRLFWDSPHTVRYGADEILHGHDAIAAFNARRRALGESRRLDQTVITTYGRDTARRCSSKRRPARSAARCKPGCACPRAGAWSRPMSA